jgi:hypothetical protein
VGRDAGERAGTVNGQPIGWIFIGLFVASLYLLAERLWRK